jgi:hypothetical protein
MIEAAAAWQKLADRAVGISDSEANGAGEIGVQRKV